METSALTINLTCFVAGLLGVIANILFKISTLRTSAKVANAPFSIAGYFQDDWFPILLSVFTVGLCVFVRDEIIQYSAKIGLFIKIFFILAGYSGSSILQKLLSKATERVNQIIDTKTDIADAVEKP